MSLNIDELLYDPDLNAVEFSIIRKTWIQESGVPRLVGLEEIFSCGTIHPADPEQLDLLPEESRHDPIILIHSTEPLYLGEEDGDCWTAPDEIHWDNRVFRVFQIRPWQAFGFWKGWAVEI